MSRLLEQVQVNDSPVATISTKAAKVGRSVSDWAVDLLPASQRFLGIEFDRNLVKFILVDGEGQNSSVRFLKVKFLPADSDAEILRVLRDHRLQMGLRPGTSAAIAIPRHSVHAKILRLPSHDPVELRKMADFQLREELPLSPDQVIFDLRIIAFEDDGHTRVMAVIARASEVKRFADLCRKAGFVTSAVRLNIEAIFQSMGLLQQLPGGDCGCVALVDVDFSATNVLIVDQGNLLFCRSVGRGVGELMDCMRGSERRAAYENWVAMLAKGIEDTISSFDKNRLLSPVDTVILTGWLPGADQMIRKLAGALGRTVRWSELTMPGIRHTEENEKPMTHHWFSVSALFGMAIAPEAEMMNLLPVETQTEQRKRSALRQLTYTGLLLVYILLALVIGTEVGIHHRQQAAEEIQAKVSALQPEVRAVNEWKKVRQSLQRQLGSTAPTAPLLAGLLKTLPASVQLQSLTFVRGETLVMRGSASGMQSVLDLPEQLAQQPGFEEAVITTANRRVRKDDMSVDFEIKISLRKSEALTSKE